MCDFDLESTVGVAGNCSMVFAVSTTTSSSDYHMGQITQHALRPNNYHRAISFDQGFGTAHLRIHLLRTHARSFFSARGTGSTPSLQVWLTNTAIRPPCATPRQCHRRFQPLVAPAG